MRKHLGYQELQHVHPRVTPAASLCSKKKITSSVHTTYNAQRSTDAENCTVLHIQKGLQANKQKRRCIPPKTCNAVPNSANWCTHVENDTAVLRNMCLSVSMTCRYTTPHHKQTRVVNTTVSLTTEMVFPHLQHESSQHDAKSHQLSLTKHMIDASVTTELD